MDFMYCRKKKAGERQIALLLTFHPRQAVKFASCQILSGQPFSAKGL